MFHADLGLDQTRSDLEYWPTTSSSSIEPADCCWPQGMSEHSGNCREQGGTQQPPSSTVEMADDQIALPAADGLLNLKKHLTCLASRVAFHQADLRLKRLSGVLKMSTTPAYRAMLVDSACKHFHLDCLPPMLSCKHTCNFAQHIFITEYEISRMTAISHCLFSKINEVIFLTLAIMPVCFVNVMYSYMSFVTVRLNIVQAP